MRSMVFGLSSRILKCPHVAPKSLRNRFQRALETALDTDGASKPKRDAAQCISRDSMIFTRQAVLHKAVVGGCTCMYAHTMGNDIVGMGPFFMDGFSRNDLHV